MSDETAGPVRRRKAGPGLSKPEPAAPAPTTPDPVEIAMEAEATGQTPGGAALEVLRANAALMREQIGLARNERFRNRIKAVRDGALVALMIGAIAGLGWLVFNAAQDRSVVMQAWSVPSEISDTGLTGAVLAGDLVGRISQMQREAEALSYVASVDTLEEGQDALRIEIPSTGVSFGELETYLRRRLGRQRIITGSVIRQGEAVTLTVRMSGAPNQSFQGGIGDLADLTRQAAEAIMLRTQPLRYADYLSTVGRLDDARAVLVPLTQTGTTEERASAFASLGQLLSSGIDTQAPTLAGRQAVWLNPNDVNTQLFLAFTAYGLSHSQEDFDALSAAQRALNDRGARARLSPAGLQRARPVIAYALAEDQADFQQAATMVRQIEDLTGGYFGVRAVALARARDLAASRDAVRSQQTVAPDGRMSAAGHTARTQIYQAVATDDWVKVRDVARARLDELGDASQPNIDGRRRLLMPYLAIALARTGDVAGARAVVSQTPLDCDLCVRARGTVEGLAGNVAGSEAEFRRVTARAPSLPFAFSEWGEARLARGDAAGAIPLFRQAQAKGPRWADPIKYEGDALARLGDVKGATGRYREALTRAPRWGGLHMALARALEASGKADAALVEYRAAAALDLSVAERAGVTRRLDAFRPGSASS